MSKNEGEFVSGVAPRREIYNVNGYGTRVNY